MFCYPWLNILYVSLTHQDEKLWGENNIAMGPWAARVRLNSDTVRKPTYSLQKIFHHMTLQHIFYFIYLCFFYFLQVHNTFLVIWCALVNLMGLILE